MSYSRIICLVKGDETDASVVNAAVEMLSNGNRSLRFVHVIVVGHRFALDASNSAGYGNAERILRDAEHIAGLRSDVRGAILQARSVGPVLVREALDFGAEAIVMAAKITSTINSKHLDSDSEYLIANAPCAVILVRQAEEDYEPTDDHPNTHIQTDALLRN